MAANFTYIAVSAFSAEKVSAKNVFSHIIYRVIQLKEEIYNRTKAKEYAALWAYSRNKRYYNFDNIGGDCTNFISQCIYAGSGIMNYSANNGWYYNSINDRSPSWTGVEFLYDFLVNNKSVGPRGTDTEIYHMEIGDIIQLSFDGKKFGHSLMIVNIDNQFTPDNLYTASHTDDSYNRKLSSYTFEKIRFIHINSVWKW